jgi:hypothetical protein
MASLNKGSPFDPALPNSLSGLVDVEEFVHCVRATIPCMIVVDQDQAAGENVLPEFLQADFCRGVPVCIEPQQGDRRRIKAGK